jgi:hypothetical protein
MMENSMRTLLSSSTIARQSLSPSLSASQMLRRTMTRLALITRRRPLPTLLSSRSHKEMTQMSGSSQSMPTDSQLSLEMPATTARQKCHSNHHSRTHTQLSTLHRRVWPLDNEKNWSHVRTVFALFNVHCMPLTMESHQVLLCRLSSLSHSMHWLEKCT